MNEMIKTIEEQAKLLLANDSWVREKIESLKTDKEKREFLAVAAMYALSKNGVQF